MKESIKWDEAGSALRTAVVELVGWCNKSGSATPMGKRIAKTNWDNLNECTKNVLVNHGVTR